jgi:TRAP-type C4-dicarboxylate transport system permease small subunit
MKIRVITMFTTGLMVAVFLGVNIFSHKFPPRVQKILHIISLVLIFFLGGMLITESLFLYERYQYLTVPNIKVYLGKTQTK